jgi:predicted RecA/RadA family phage recombinase
MATNYQQDGNTMDWTNDSGALVVSGQPVAVGSIVGVAHDDIAVGETGVLHTSGVFVLEKGAEEIAQGQVLYLADGTLTVAAAGDGEDAAANPRAGSAWAAATADETDVAVRLGF